MRLRGGVLTVPPARRPGAPELAGAAEDRPHPAWRIANTGRALAYAATGVVEASHQPGREPVALVLAGGGARGAYELGALSVLLPELPQDERPDIILGTSVGAINAAYLAATADQWPANLERSLEEGLQLWRRLMRWRSVVKPLGSWAQIKLLLSAVADGLGVPGAHSWSLLDPGPLRDSLDVHLPLERVRVNVENDAIRTAAVVATRASTGLSVALCVTDDHIPDRDLRRGIQYVPVEELCLDHVLASAAIPGAFPAVSLTLPGQPAHWFSDGGTRLNTPISVATPAPDGSMAWLRSGSGR